MIPSSAPRAALRRLCVPAALVLLGTLGCHKKQSSQNLFVYDGGTNTVLVWDDIQKVYDGGQTGGTVPAPDRTISAGLLAPTLAWGGLALDSNANMLYLVTTQGLVTRINNASNQSGALSQSKDILQFNLGNAASDRFSSGSVFGQASVDESSHTLYVVETSTDGTGTRIWNIAGANNAASSTTYSPATQYTISVTNDTWGSGVTAGSAGQVYGLFGSGTALTDPSSNVNVVSPRLRQGRTSYSTVFPTNPLNLNQAINVVFGNATGLNAPLNYGALAYDGSNNVVYAFAQPGTAWPATPAATYDAQIVMFNVGDFSAGGNQAPNKTLTSVEHDLRIISHPTSLDWLLGATYVPASTTTPGPAGTGAGSLLIWKDPSGGSAEATSVPLSGVSQILGMAVGGND